MGGSVSQVFRSGSALLSHRDGHKVSESTIDKVQMVFEILRTNPKVRINMLEALLVQIPKYENILAVQDEAGYNLLQRSIGLNHVDLVRWLLTRHCLDVNRSPCSLPLHIACLKGYEECVELLLKHGARIDTEARMCFPGLHSSNCEERGKHKPTIPGVPGTSVCDQVPVVLATTTKLQNSLCYAIDGDQINVLNTLSQRMEEPWMPFRVKKPLLHLACERGAWKCVQQLVITRSDEINLIKDEYYPIHQAILHDLRFLELLIMHGAETTVRTCTQQMTLLHVVLLHARKSADDVLQTLRILLERGCKELINAPDSLGNTPLHALIVRYALEEAKYGYDKWNKWDVLHLVRFLLQNGAKSSINQAGNSALACVFRHIRDWDVCYEILTMLIKEDGDPNIVGRDGSVPLMVCLVPLINKDPLHHFTHTMKVCYLNCIRILLQHGANPNEQYRSTLTPLHVLIFTVSENFTLICEDQKRMNFDFIKNILLLLLQHGLDVRYSSEHILQSCIEMVQNVRTCPDIQCLYELTLILVQYGANVNVTNLCGKFNYLDMTSGSWMTAGGNRHHHHHHHQAAGGAVSSVPVQMEGIVAAQPADMLTTGAAAGASISSSSSSSTGVGVSISSTNTGTNNVVNNSSNSSNTTTNNGSNGSSSSVANPANAVVATGSSSTSTSTVGNASQTAANTRARDSFRNAKNNLLFYYLMLVTKKEFLLCDPEQSYARIIHLLYQTMDHKQLFNCLRQLNNMYMTQVPNKQQESLVAYLAAMYRQRPRSLKQSCRLAIYEALNRRIAQNIGQLNLPSLLKEYLLSFD